MILLSTSSAEHLAAQMMLPRGMCTITTFSDGELFVQLDTNVNNQDVWVLATTCQPDRNFFELFFLLDALERNGAHINLVITYLGYARQDRAHSGEALGAEIISKFLKIFSIHKILVVHEHSKHLKSFLNFTSIVPIEPLCTLVKNYDAVVAPDEGAYTLAKNIADICILEAVAIKKIRNQEQVKIIEIVGNVYGKSVIIVDDIIATGSTLVAASNAIKELGAKEIAVYGTHGIFADNAREKLQNCAAIDAIYTTNSIDQQPFAKEYSKITILNIAHYIEAKIREYMH